MSSRRRINVNPVRRGFIAFQEDENEQQHHQQLLHESLNTTSGSGSLNPSSGSAHNNNNNNNNNNQNNQNLDGSATNLATSFNSRLSRSQRSDPMMVLGGQQSDPSSTTHSGTFQQQQQQQQSSSTYSHSREGSALSAAALPLAASSSTPPLAFLGVVDRNTARNFSKHRAMAIHQGLHSSGDSTAAATSGGTAAASADGEDLAFSQPLFMVVGSSSSSRNNKGNNSNSNQDNNSSTGKSLSHEERMLRDRVEAVLKREQDKSQLRKQREQEQLQRDAREIELWFAWHREQEARERAAALQDFHAFGNNSSRHNRSGLDSSSSLPARGNKGSRHRQALRFMRSNGENALSDNDEYDDDVDNNSNNSDDDDNDDNGGELDDDDDQNALSGTLRSCSNGLSGTLRMSSGLVALGHNTSSCGSSGLLPRALRRGAGNNNNVRRRRRGSTTAMMMLNRPRYLLAENSTYAAEVLGLKDDNVVAEQQQRRASNATATTTPPLTPVSPASTMRSGHQQRQQQQKAQWSSSKEEQQQKSVITTSPRRYQNGEQRFYADPENYLSDVVCRVNYRIATTLLGVCEHDESCSRSNMREEEDTHWDALLRFFRRGCELSALKHFSRQLVSQLLDERDAFFTQEMEGLSALHRVFLNERQRIRKGDLYQLFLGCDAETQKLLLEQPEEKREHFLDMLAEERYLKSKVSQLRRTKK